MARRELTNRLHRLEQAAGRVPADPAAEAAEHGTARWRMPDGSRCYGDGDSMTVLSGGCTITYRVPGIDLWEDQ